MLAYKTSIPRSNLGHPDKMYTSQWEIKSASQHPELWKPPLTQTNMSAQVPVKLPPVTEILGKIFRDPGVPHRSVTSHDTKRLPEPRVHKPHTSTSPSHRHPLVHPLVHPPVRHASMGSNMGSSSPLQVHPQAHQIYPRGYEGQYTHLAQTHQNHQHGRVFNQYAQSHPSPTGRAANPPTPPTNLSATHLANHMATLPVHSGVYPGSGQHGSGQHGSGQLGSGQYGVGASALAYPYARYAPLPVRADSPVARYTYLQTPPQVYRHRSVSPHALPSSYESSPLSFPRRRGRKRKGNAICTQCGLTQTPEWRRGPEGVRTLCNACGLYFLKLVKKFGAQDAAMIFHYKKVNDEVEDRMVPTARQKQWFCSLVSSGQARAPQ